MKIDRDTRWGALLVRLGALLIRAIVSLLRATCRLEVVAGQDHLEALLTGADRPPTDETATATDPPVVLSFWHNRSMLALHLIRGVLIRRGLDVTSLISQSRDGDLAAHLADAWNMKYIRGSSTRGGREALRAIYKVTRDGSSPVMIPDGPHGPLYRFKVGAAVLAQMSQAPILPLGFAASSAWRIKSWDRLIVPKPFARITVVVGPPQRLQRNLDSDALEAERQRLETLITTLTDRAEAALEA